MQRSREERLLTWEAQKWKFQDDTPMVGPPGCTADDIAIPKLRKCPFELSTVSFLEVIGTGRDGYCWLVQFGDEGPFVLKVFRERSPLPGPGGYYPFRIECRNAALLQMIEQAVADGAKDGKPPQVIRQPVTWFDAMDNIGAFPTEVRQDTETWAKWAKDYKVDLVPLLSVPRLRKCYGWLKIGLDMLLALPDPVRPLSVRVSRKDTWTFGDDKNNDDDDDDDDPVLYNAIVYEYIEPGENDPATVQETLDFYLRSGFSQTYSGLAQNWQSSVLLDLSDIMNPYEATFHTDMLTDGMKVETTLGK